MLGIFLFFQSALLCAVQPNSTTQSTFELIDSADAIVVAEAVEQRNRNDIKLNNFDDIELDVFKGSILSQEVVFDVRHTLKGRPTKQVVQLRAELGEGRRSLKDSITSSIHGNENCGRMKFQQGDLYVLMLVKSDKNGFVVTDAPFSRNAEDFYGMDSMWLKAIQEYIRIQSKKDRMAQIDDLFEIIDRGLKKEATPYQLQLALISFSHLMKIHPDKPVEWLLRVYDNPN